MPYYQPATSLPVTDTQTLVMGSADTTKLLRIEVDGFTTGTTRVLTPPNANATIAGLEVANVFTTDQTVNTKINSSLFVSIGYVSGMISSDSVLEFHYSAGNVAFDLRNDGVPRFAKRLVAAQGVAVYNDLQFESGSIYKNISNAPKLGPDNTEFYLLSQGTGGNAVVTDVVHFYGRRTGSAPAAGFGIGILTTLHSSSSSDRNAARQSMLWATATDASRKARVLYTVYDTAEREYLRAEADGSNPMLGFLGASAIARPTTYTLASTATRTMPTPESAFTGQDNLQVGSVYAKSADIITLQTRVDSVEGVLRQLIIDLASTSGYGLLVAS